MCQTFGTIMIFMLNCFVLQAELIRVWHDFACPVGNNAELGNAQGQHVTRPTAQSSSQVHGSSRQPLQLRPDHGNASSFLPDSPLHHQGSGDKQRFLPNNVSANAHKRF